MAKLRDLTGQRFGRLIVIKRTNNDKYNHTMWLCKCECDKDKIIAGYSLISGHTKSCGCLQKECASNANKGKSLSEKTKNKISKSLKGNKCHLGFHHSEETKRKLSESHEGNIPWNKGLYLPKEILEINRKKSILKCNHSIKGRNRSLKWQRKNKEKIKEYSQSFKGKIVSTKAHRKNKCKRRQLGFFALNKPFEGCDAHHISENFVIYMPRDLHNCLYHNIWNWKNMNKMNKLAIEFLLE